MNSNIISGVGIFLKESIKQHGGAALAILILIIFNCVQFVYIDKKDKELKDCNKEVKSAVLMLVDELRLMREQDKEYHINK